MAQIITTSSSSSASSSVKRLPALPILSRKKRKFVQPLGTIRTSKRSKSNSKKRKLTKQNKEEKKENALVTFAKDLGENPMLRANALVKCHMNGKTMTILREACLEISNLLDARLETEKICTQCYANAPKLSACYCGKQRFCKGCKTSSDVDSDSDSDSDSDDYLNDYRCAYCKTPFCNKGKCCSISCENDDCEGSPGSGCANCMQETRCQNVALCLECVDDYDCGDCDTCEGYCDP